MRARGWLVGLCLLPAALPAQLRGLIRDGATRAPLGGAVVTVLDGSGSMTARAITGADGRFSAARDQHAAKVRVVRIGYRPREAPLPPQGATIELVMERIPPMLNAVRVTGSELCPGSADRGNAFQAWDQARAGLLATVVARDLKPAMAKTVMYESHMSPNDDRIHAQTKHLASGRTSRPFVAAQTPLYFARYGYIMDDPSARIYNAPDADVLLDESFATTHCFRVQPADADHPGQVGVSFVPAPGRDTLTDVTGVIWIDATTPELRSLDFLYTSLERAAMSARTGGHIEFRAMPNGVSFIERWHLRLPSLEVLPFMGSVSRAPRDQLHPVSRRERTDYRVRELVEAGGIVLEAKWADGTEFRDTPATIIGTVTQRKANAPVANAIVTLAGTQDTALTDAAGRFELAAIPGKYTLAVSDTALHGYVQARLASQPVDAVRARTTMTHAELAPLREVIDNDLCRGFDVVENTVVLLGHVWAPDRARLPSAVVTTTWEQAFLAAVGTAAIRGVRRDSDVDTEGRFVVCAVEVDRRARLRLSTGKETLADTTIQLHNGPDITQSFEWRLAPIAPKMPPRE